MTAQVYSVNFYNAMGWDYLAQTLTELRAPPKLVEACNYLFMCGDHEGAQACINQHAREPESGCVVLKAGDLKVAPFAMPAPWAISAAKRICVKLGGTTEMMVLARLLEQEAGPLCRTRQILARQPPPAG